MSIDTAIAVMIGIWISANAGFILAGLFGANGADQGDEGGR